MNLYIKLYRVLFYGIQRLHYILDLFQLVVQECNEKQDRSRFGFLGWGRLTEHSS